MQRAAVAEDSAADFQRPSRVAGFFDPAGLRSHYVLSRASSVAPDDWSRASLGGWNLAAAPDLPILRLDDAAGAQVGWVIGHPVDLAAGRVVSETIGLSCDLARSDVEVALDEELHRLGGRWVAVVLTPYPMVFPDGYGALPVLAASRAEAVTSSPFLVDSGDQPVDSRFVDVFRVFETGVDLRAADDAARRRRPRSAESRARPALVCGPSVLAAEAARSVATRRCDRSGRLELRGLDRRRRGRPARPTSVSQPAATLA